MALKAVEKTKNEFRRKLRLAKKEGLSTEAIHSIAKQFFSLLRSHSSLKRSAQKSDKLCYARRARQDYHKDLHKYARRVLDSDSTSHNYYIS